jgi:hypothetical protein
MGIKVSSIRYLLPEPLCLDLNDVLLAVVDLLAQPVALRYDGSRARGG